MNKNNKTEDTPVPVAAKAEDKRPVKAGEVRVQIYYSYYYFPVNNALSESIRLTQINHLRASKKKAPKGSKGYKAAVAKVIRERIIHPWKYKDSYPNGEKIEFNSPETKGYTVPFSVVKFG